MPGNSKLLERIRNKREVRQATLVRLLKSFGFEERPGGNHIVFTYEDEMIPIPHKRRLGRLYVKTVVTALDEIIRAEKGAADAEADN